MGVVVEYPINMHVDNVGDILLSKNKFVSNMTKKIYMCNQLFSDYFEDRTMIIQFFRS